MRCLRSKRGFSLIELVAGAALLAAAFLGLTLTWQELAESTPTPPEHTRTALREAVLAYLNEIDWERHESPWTAFYVSSEGAWRQSGPGISCAFRVTETTEAFRRVEVRCEDVRTPETHWIPLIVPR